MMIPDFQSLYLAKLPTFEGKSPWLYLDSRRIAGKPAPLVTVGIGCALQLPEALTLPFTILDRPATAEEITREWTKVEAMMPGMHYTSYDYPGCLILPEPAIETLCLHRLAAFTLSLQRIFPAFDTFPVNAKVGLLDLIYGLGEHGLASSYTILQAAVNRRDWAMAARQCASDASNAAYDIRNQWRKNQFLAAITNGTVNA